MVIEFQVFSSIQIQKKVWKFKICKDYYYSKFYKTHSKKKDNTIKLVDFIIENSFPYPLEKYIKPFYTTTTWGVKMQVRSTIH